MGKGGRIVETTAVPSAPELASQKAAGTHEWRESTGKQVWCVKDIQSKRIKTALPTYTRAEVAKHNTKDDCWLIIHDRVYDISKWIDNHPGGYLPLVNVAGRDATDNFAAYHPVFVWEKKLPYFLIGELPEAEAKATPFQRAYRSVQQQLLEAGLHQTRYSYYAKLFTWLAVLFSVVLFLSVKCQSTWAHMAGAVLLGLFFQQTAFVGHDLGHNGISHDNRVDSLMGLVFGNILTGISMGWWKWNHNTHHNVCNSMNHDPDVQYLPLFSPNQSMLRSFYSSFHRRVFKADAVARVLTQYQHLLYYPVMMVARFNLYAQSFIFIHDTKVPTVSKPLELAGLAVFYTWLLTLLSSMPTWGQFFAYLLVSHATSAILHIQICLSHFPMPTYEGHPMQGTDEDSWWVLQVATTMDIDCPTWMDWFHGGLQFQTEHHLFPRIPRHNLRQVRPIVKALCEQHGIRYTAMTFFEANVAMMRSLREAAGAAATLDVSNQDDVSDGSKSNAVAVFRQSTLFEGFNAIG